MSLFGFISLSLLSCCSSKSEEFKHSVFLEANERVLLSWTVREEFITFEVAARTLGYVGIGFSANGRMDGADFMLGWVTNGIPYIQVRQSMGVMTSMWL